MSPGWTLGLLEARVGFEPTNGGFADLSLGPLGYRAKQSSIANRPRLVADVVVEGLFTLSFEGPLPGHPVSAKSANRKTPKRRKRTSSNDSKATFSKTRLHEAPLLLFDRRSHSRLAQKSRRFFRWRRVDVKSRSPLEPRHLRQLRDDLHVPVIVIVDLFPDR